MANQLTYITQTQLVRVVIKQCLFSIIYIGNLCIGEDLKYNPALNINEKKTQAHLVVLLAN